MLDHLDVERRSTKRFDILFRRWKSSDNVLHLSLSFKQHPLSLSLSLSFEPLWFGRTHFSFVKRTADRETNHFHLSLRIFSVLLPFEFSNCRWCQRERKKTLEMEALKDSRFIQKSELNQGGCESYFTSNLDVISTHERCRYNLRSIVVNPVMQGYVFQIQHFS